MSHHGTADDVFPYERGPAANTTQIMDGSLNIHKRGDEIGIINKLFTQEGGDHIYMQDCNSCLEDVRHFLAQLMFNDYQL